MKEAMDTMHFETVDKVLSELRTKNLDLDVKLMKAAEVLHLKLDKQKEINEFIASLAHVPNYKTIKKSVSILEEKVKKAKELNVDIDQEILDKVNANIGRLIAERNLQFQMEKVRVFDSGHEDVRTLEDLIHIAKATGVAAEYTDRADVYLDKMKRNIRAREILDLLEAYPPREYPEVEEPDSKKKGGRQEAPPPKKKKKKGKKVVFDTPDWCTNLDNLKEEVKNLEGLVQDAENLELDDTFTERTVVVFERFKKKEIPFREEELRIEAEKEALKKAKKAAKKKN